ncbi:hypothetical protein AAZX31_14G087500 [Glycine max]
MHSLFWFPECPIQEVKKHLEKSARSNLGSAKSYEASTPQPFVVSGCPTRCPYDRCPHSNILDTDTDTMPVRQVSVFVSCPVSVLMSMLYRQEAKVLSVLFVLSHEPVYHDNILAEAC